MAVEEQATVTREGIHGSIADVERRLSRLLEQIEAGEVPRTPTLDQAIEDLNISLEELHVALEELETTNDELAAAKHVAELEGVRFEELFRLAPAACFVTDVAGVIEEVNQAAELLLDRPARFLVGKPLAMFLSPDEHHRFFHFLDKIGQSETGAVVGEEEFGIRSGTERPFEAGVTAIAKVDLEGRRLGARWIVRDLSDQLRAERLRRQTGERAAYRHIAGGVIHHLNNLLGSIRGYSELLAREPEITDRGTRATRQILSATERGERLTTQLLAFARVGGREKGLLTLDSIVHEACEGARGVLLEESPIVERLAADGARVHADNEDLYQAILSLVFNAHDARSDHGEIGVATELMDLEAETARKLALEPGPFVRIAVQDSGIGMEQETRDRALEPFFSTKAIGSGFGLGLSTVEAIVREAGGAVEIESELGAGSVVTLYLPVA